MAASFSQPATTASAPPSSGGGGGSSTVSVEIRCTCGKTVPVFYGDTPKYGSGTSSSCSSNSVSSKSFQAGDKMWLVDDGENGVASVTVAPSIRTIEVGCTSITAR